MKYLKFFKFFFSFKFTLICFAVILYLSFMNAGAVKIPKLTIFFGHFDLIVHFFMYFGLSFLFFAERYRKFEYSAESIQFLNCQKFILLFVLSSFLIEVFQPIISNRSRELSDFLANTAGCYTGFFCLRLLKNVIFNIGFCNK